MKILEICFHLAAGGAERFVVDLSNELALTNDVTLLTLKNENVNPEIRNFYKSELSENVKYENLGLNDGLRPSMWWKIWRVIKRISPNVVHFHGDGMPYWMIPAIIFSSKTITFCQTIHSDIKNGYTRPIYKLFVKFLGNKHRVRFTAISPTNFQELLRVYPKIKAKLIENGRSPIVHTPEFEKVKEELACFKRNRDTKLFLHIARLSKVKDQQLLFSAFNKFAENHNAELIVIGPGYEQKECLMNIGPHIHILGSKKNVSDYHILSDVFCLSSKYEGMPITLLEALLSGTPIISTPVCGAIDLIRDGVNGIITKDHSVDSYTQGLIHIYNKLPYFTQACLIDIEHSNKYLISHCAKRYLSFFVSQR